MLKHSPRIAPSERAFIEMGALVVLSILEKFASQAGNLTSCVASFEKLSLLDRRLNGNILALSIEASVDPNTIAEMDYRLSRIPGK